MVLCHPGVSGGAAGAGGGVLGGVLGGSATASQLLLLPQSRAHVAEVAQALSALEASLRGPAGSSSPWRPFRRLCWRCWIILPSLSRGEVPAAVSHAGAAERAGARELQDQGDAGHGARCSGSCSVAVEVTSRAVTMSVAVYQADGPSFFLHRSRHPFFAQMQLPPHT